MPGLDAKYMEYAELLNDIVSDERELYNKKKVIADLKNELSSEHSDGGYGIELSAHSFKQIAERLEVLAMENSIIYKDVFKSGSPQDSLLLASNMKSFVITLLANARNKKQFKEDESNSGGTEFRYTIDIKKWSNEKTLQFVAIVENNNIKTGFFNWV